MPTVPYKLVTIITERAVRDRIIAAVHRLGATGHTVTQVQGEGTRGTTTSWEGHSTKIETIVPENVADAIVAHVAERYFEHHSVIVYLQDVGVVRGSKYGPHNESA